MILSEKFVEELRVVERLDQDMYEKAVQFAFNLIIKNENEVRLAEVLEIDDREAEVYLELLLRLIFYFSKYRATNAELDICLEATQLSEAKRRFFREVHRMLIQRLLVHLLDVRKKLFKRFEDNQDRLKDVSWRFQVEVASKTCKNDFKPNILLDFITVDGKSKETHNTFSSDFANLKNLHEQLLDAFKQHDSNKHKKMIGSYL